MRKDPRLPVSENNTSGASEPRLPRVLLACILLVSFSSLAFEVNMLRILSTALNYHYVFLVVSVALLGMGLGGILSYHWGPRLVARYGRDNLLIILMSALALSIPFSVILITRTPYLASQTLQIGLDSLLFFIPFFIIGLFLAQVFRSFAAHSSKLYGADLIGAAAGSLGVLLIMNRIGSLPGSFLVAVLAAVAALLFALRKPPTEAGVKAKTALPIVSVIIVAGILGASLSGLGLNDIPIGRNPDKEIYNSLNDPVYNGEIIETRWSSFGRVDLVASADVPDLMGIFIDGRAGSTMLQFNGDFDNPPPAVRNLQTTFTGYFPFHNLDPTQQDSILLIGPGGGRDVLVAGMGGVKNVTAVEVSQDVVDIVNEYSWYNGDVYGADNVQLFIEEGRNFLKRQPDKYDFIMLSLPVTRSSRSLEGYALTEDFLLTTDSMSDYLDHLTDEGQIIFIGHDWLETYRLLDTALAAFEARGLTEGEFFDRVYIVGTYSLPLLVIKQTPFTPEEMAYRHGLLAEMSYTPEFYYFPTITPTEADSATTRAMAIVGSGELNFRDYVEANFRKQGVDISPVSDNSPFFYYFETGIPRSVAAILYPALIVMVLLVVIPLRRWRNRAPPKRTKPTGEAGLRHSLPRFAVLFTMLGLGFMLAEISLTQRLILFVGQPVYSLSIMLFSILVGAGVGSIISARIATPNLKKWLLIMCLAIFAMLLAYNGLLPTVFEQFLGFSLNTRFAAAAGALIPLGFVMGFPFPTGLRLIRSMTGEKYIPWLYGINGVSSVLGSVLAIAITMNLGFREALFIAAACYIAAFLVFRRADLSAQRTEPEPVAEKDPA